MEDCEEIVKHRLITREEKSKKISLLNVQGEQVKVVEVDGCKITEGNRCDWLFVQLRKKDEIFVELKGSDIAHACLQLETTIKKLTGNLRKLKYAIVVCSKVAPAIKTNIQIQKKRFKKHLDADLIIEKNHCCFDLSKNKEIDCSSI